MKTLLMFFLLVSPPLAFSQKVKEVEGLKVPKGLTATQDSLENRITIKSPVYSHFAVSNPYNPLSLRIVVTGKGITPVFDVYCFGSSWVYMNEAAVYVKNKDMEKYSFPIEDKGSNVLSWAGSTYVVEDSSIIDSKLHAFLQKNVNPKSEITVRFSGDQGYMDIRLSKKQVGYLFASLEYLDQLKNKKQP